VRGVPTLEPPRVTMARVGTDAHESNGTLEWDGTIVLAGIGGGGQTGGDYTYGGPAAGAYIRETLGEAVTGLRAFVSPAAHRAMLHALRNDGRPGIALMVLAALGKAPWDLKARLLDLSVAQLLAQAQQSVTLCCSGGFTSYDDDRLERQLGACARAVPVPVRVRAAPDPSRPASGLSVRRKAVDDLAI
jgi:L-alanine-DL-glutamate epimerase-like enolase superfamily enzyme